MSTIQTPVISINRQTRVIGCFDDLTLVRDFQPYTDEAAALMEAKAWCKERSDQEPQVVYPVIRRLTMRT